MDTKKCILQVFFSTKGASPHQTLDSRSFPGSWRSQAIPSKKCYRAHKKPIKGEIPPQKPMEKRGKIHVSIKFMSQAIPWNSRKKTVFLFPTNISLRELQMPQDFFHQIFTSTRCVMGLTVYGQVGPIGKLWSCLYFSVWCICWNHVCIFLKFINYTRLFLEQEKVTTNLWETHGIFHTPNSRQHKG